MTMQWETVWSFHTKQFVVALAVTDEDMAPDDQFSEPEDVEFAREGGWHWFQARVQVSFVDHDDPKGWADTRERVLGEGYLGGCSYHGLDDFRADGYFRDMVRSAIGEARGTLTRLKSLPTRAS